MSKTPSNLNEYIRQQLKRKNYNVIAVESRRNGQVGPNLRPDLHSSEALREQAMLSITDKENRLRCIAIDPDSGRFEVLQIFGPDGELPFDEKNGLLSPTSSEASAIALKEVETIRKTGAAVSAIAEKIVSAKIKDYETLIENIPDDVDQEVALRQLRHAKGNLIEIETTEGSLSVGGYYQLSDTIPCREHYTVVVDVEKTEKGTKQSPSITFKSVAPQPEGCSLPPMLKNRLSIHAEIATSDKRGALKFIHFSLAQEKYVKLVLELAYTIRTGRWSIRVVDILDVRDLVDNAKSAQMMFENW